MVKIIMLPSRTATPPLLTILLLMLGSGFITTFLSIRMELLGHSDTVIGLVQGAYYGGMLAGAFVADRILRLLGHRWTDVGAVGLLILSLLLHIFSTNPVYWAVLRATQGFCIGVTYVVVESWILGPQDGMGRGRLLGWYTAAIYGGQTLSQPILSLLDWESAQPFLVAGLLCSLALIPGWVGRRTGPVYDEPHRFLHLYRRAPWGALTGFVSGLILASLYTFAPIYAEDTGISPPTFMAILILGGVLAQWPVGHLGDTISRRYLLIGLALTGALLALPLWLFPHGFALRLLLAFLLGAATFTLYPASLMYFADHLTHQQLVKGAALLNLLYGLGAAVGPVTASTITGPLPSTSLFLFIAFWTALIGILGLGQGRLRKDARLPKDKG
jgi:MFS family permease